MAIVIRASDIKYTIMALEAHEIDYAIEMVKDYLIDAPKHRLAEAHHANGIYGFVINGAFWHPRVTATKDWLTGLDKDLKYVIVEAHPETALAYEGTIYGITGYDYSREGTVYDVHRSACGVTYAVVT